jgi:hypothetical protein
VQHVAVDIDQLTAIGTKRDPVSLPDLFEQSLGHDLAAFMVPPPSCVGRQSEGKRAAG